VVLHGTADAPQACLPAAWGSLPRRHHLLTWLCCLALPMPGPPSFLRRNWIHVMRHWGPKRAAQHIPDFAQRIVAEVGGRGWVEADGEGPV
jgi:hypothetical protein